MIIIDENIKIANLVFFNMKKGESHASSPAYFPVFCVIVVIIKIVERIEEKMLIFRPPF